MSDKRYEHIQREHTKDKNRDKKYCKQEIHNTGHICPMQQLLNSYPSLCGCPMMSGYPLLYGHPYEQQYTCMCPVHTNGTYPAGQNIYQRAFEEIYDEEKNNDLRIKDWYEKYESDPEDLFEESSEDYEYFETVKDHKKYKHMNPWYYWPPLFNNPYMLKKYYDED
ncbi:MAG: hypothetical protein ACOZCL_18875 [Bacillota bacterium]